MKRKFSDWVIIMLIILFFAIPVCSLAVTDSITLWPKCPTSFLYLIEPLAKVSEKHIEKAFPEELESISCWIFDLSSFGSHLKDGFLSAGHIAFPLSTFF